MPVLAWLARLATSPIVASVLIPALSDALSKFFARQADRLELRAAIRVAKVGKTADDLRDASKRLTDAASRR